MAITGKISGGGSRLVGKIGVRMLPYYEGEYTVTPRLNESVILETEQKSMSQNVTVQPIPIYETENSAGGLTVIIG